MDSLDNDKPRAETIAAEREIEWILRADSSLATRLGTDRWPDWGRLAPAIASAYSELRLGWSVFCRKLEAENEGASPEAVRLAWVNRLLDALGYRTQSWPPLSSPEAVSGITNLAATSAESLFSPLSGPAKVAVGVMHADRSAKKGHPGTGAGSVDDSSIAWMQDWLAADRTFAAGVVTDGQKWAWVFPRSGKSATSPSVVFDLARIVNHREMSGFWNFARISHASGSWRAVAALGGLDADANSGPGQRLRLARVAGTPSGFQMDIDRIPPRDQRSSDRIRTVGQRAWDRVYDQAIQAIAKDLWQPATAVSPDKLTGSQSRVFSQPTRLLMILGFESIEHASTGVSGLDRELARRLRHRLRDTSPSEDTTGSLELLIADRVRIAVVNAACRHWKSLARVLDEWNELEPHPGAMLATDGRYVVTRVPVPEFSARAVSAFDLCELVLGSRFDAFQDLFRQVEQMRRTATEDKSDTRDASPAVPARSRLEDRTSGDTKVVYPDEKRLLNGLPDEVRDFIRGYEAKSERDRSFLEACLDQLRSIEKSIAKTTKSREIQEQRALRQAIQEMLDERLPERTTPNRLRKPAVSEGGGPSHPATASSSPPDPSFGFLERRSQALSESMNESFALRSREAVHAGIRELPTRRVEMPIPANLLPLPVDSVEQLWEIPFASLGMLQVALNRDRMLVKDRLGPDDSDKNPVLSSFVIVWLGPESEKDGLRAWCEKVGMSRLGLRAFPVLGDRWVMLPRSSPRTEEVASILLSQPGPVGLTELKSMLSENPSLQAVNNLVSRMDFVGGGSKESRSRAVDRDEMGKPIGSARGYELRLGPLPAAEKQRYRNALAAPPASAETVVVPYIKDFHRDMIRLGEWDPLPVVEIDGAGENQVLARVIAAGQGLQSRTARGWGR